MNVAVTGYPSSGKSIATRIAEEVGFHTVVMGDNIRRRTEEMWGERLEMARSGESDETVSTVYGEFATEMREKHGYGVVAEWCLEEIEQAEGDVFIDGMRSPEERTAFEESIEMELVYINAPASLRLQRMKDRGRDGEDTFDATDILDRDSRENDWGLNELVQSAEHTVHNCTTKDRYEKDLRDLFSTLISN